MEHYKNLSGLSDTKLLLYIYSINPINMYTLSCMRFTSFSSDIFIYFVIIAAGTWQRANNESSKVIDSLLQVTF